MLGRSVTFREEYEWRQRIQTNQSILQNHPEPDEKTQFYQLLGGKLLKSFHGVVFPFERYIENIAHDQQHGNLHFDCPLALAELFDQERFVMFFEIDWDVLESRSPLDETKIRRIGTAVSQCVRQFVADDAGVGVEILVCTTMNDADDAVPFRDNFLQCMGCQKGHVEFNKRTKMYACTFCQNRWEKVFENLSTRTLDHARNRDWTRAGAPDADDDPDRDSTFRCVRSATHDPNPVVQPVAKVKNGLHIRCRGLYVSSAVALTLRRCLISRLMVVFPRENTDDWARRIDPDPYSGGSLRMLGMYKKATCHRCSGSGTLTTRTNKTLPCDMCPGSRGKLPVDKRYRVWDLVTVGATPEDDVWMRDCADAELQAAASVSTSSNSSSSGSGGNGHGHGGMPHYDRWQRFKTDLVYAHRQASISQVPAGAIVVACNREETDLIPSDDPVCATRPHQRKYKGITRTMQRWVTIYKKTTGTKTALPATKHAAAKLMIRRLFPFPKTETGYFVAPGLRLPDGRDKVTARNAAAQAAFLDLWQSRTALTDPVEDDASPSPYDRVAIRRIFLIRTRSGAADAAIIEVTGMGATWCPERHAENERARAQLAPHAAQTQAPAVAPEHRSSVVYFYVSKFYQTVTVHCHSGAHICSACKTVPGSKCGHKWWTINPVRGRMLPEEWALFWGRAGSGLDAVEARMVENAADMAVKYPFLRERYGNNIPAMKQRIRDALTACEMVNKCSLMSEHVHALTGTKMAMTVGDLLGAHQNMHTDINAEGRAYEAREPLKAARRELWMTQYNQSVRSTATPQTVAGQVVSATYESSIQQRMRDTEAAVQHEADLERLKARLQSAAHCPDVAGSAGVVADVDAQLDETDVQRSKRKRREAADKKRLLMKRLKEVPVARWTPTAAILAEGRKRDRAHRKAGEMIRAACATRDAGTRIPKVKRMAMAKKIVDLLRIARLTRATP